MANKMFQFTGDTKGARHKNMGDWKASNAVLTLQTNVGSKNHYAAEFPIGPVKEAWLQYDVRFQNKHVFGRNVKASNVGFKMPGLGSRGNHSSMTGAHTGGKHNEAGFSGRLMARGVPFDGQSSKPADAFTIGLYAYDLAAAKSKYKYGRDHMFRSDGDVVNPPIRSGSGTKKGNYGDPGQWLIPIGEWVTITLGYGFTDGHWFEAWVSTESNPEPVLVLRMGGDGFRWVGHGEREEIDTALFQSFWGGGGDNWLPDRSATLEYRNWTVYDSNPIGTAPKPAAKPPTGRSIGSGLGGPYTARFELRGSTGTEKVTILRAGEDIGHTQILVYKEPTEISIDGIDHLDELELYFVNDGRTSAGKDRNVFFERLTIIDEAKHESWTIDKTDPLLFSTAAWKGGPAQGFNADIGHNGKMYRGGHLGFSNIFDAIIPASVSVPTEPADTTSPLVAETTPAEQIRAILEPLDQADRYKAVAEALA